MPFLIFLLIHCVHYGPFFSKFWSNLNFHFGILIIINVCRENSDFALVCRGSKSLENTELEQEQTGPLRAQAGPIKPIFVGALLKFNAKFRMDCRPHFSHRVSTHFWPFSAPIMLQPQRSIEGRFQSFQITKKGLLISPSLNVLVSF